MSDYRHFFRSCTAALWLTVGSVLQIPAQNSKATSAGDLPIIPVGLDAYRMWEMLPYHKIGIRAYMRSTYDREGGNRGVDASHFLYQKSDSFNVTLDVKGQGILYFKRTNHFHGSPWHYEIDGEDFIVKETATDDPIDAKNRYDRVTFIPEALFPEPLTFTWETTRGADLMWVPLGFEERLRIAYSRTFYGTGYYIYHLIPPGTSHLSRPIEKWDRTPPANDVLELLESAGTDILTDKSSMEKISGRIHIDPHQTVRILSAGAGPAMIRSLKITVPEESGFDFGKCRLRVTWDHRWHASIDAPVGLFFGAGELYNPEEKEFLVRGLPLSVRYEGDSIYLNCYWPMPFYNSAVIELQEMTGRNFKDIEFEFLLEPYTGPVNHLNYFHATYTDIPEPELGKDNVFLDTKFVEGGGDWSGHFVGMSWIFSHDGILPVLEGDPRFFFDNSNTPQGWGTGTEEWGGGGDYWGGENMTLPLAGHPIGKQKEDAKNEKDLINSAYRFLIADFFPFGKRAVIGLEHGGVNQINEHASGVAYWYGVNAASLVLTDQLNVCHEQDREAHQYSSSPEDDCYRLVSRYEWGPDRNGGGNRWGTNPYPAGSVIFYPAQEDEVKTMKEYSEFTVSVHPGNHGILIRRKFDYAYPNQEAMIMIRHHGKRKWNNVGVWYTSGSNTCVFSRPEGKNFTSAEWSPTEHHIITSNRRWREEEFPISSAFTRGAEKLDIRIEFIPNSQELFPGQPFPERSVWSASRYWIYSWVLPDKGLQSLTHKD